MSLIRQGLIDCADDPNQSVFNMSGTNNIVSNALYASMSAFGRDDRRFKLVTGFVFYGIRQMIHDKFLVVFCVVMNSFAHGNSDIRMNFMQMISPLRPNEVL